MPYGEVIPISWTTPRDWTSGELVTAATMNAHVRDNLNYLKGNAGTVTIADNLIVGGATWMGVGLFGPAGETAIDWQGDAFLYRSSAAQLRTPGDLIAGGTAWVGVGPLGPAGQAAVDWQGDTFLYRGGTAILTTDGTLSVAGMRVQRHPFANDRHVESGEATIDASGDVSVTFTNAYASAPNVVACPYGNVIAVIFVDNVTVSGFDVHLRTPAGADQAGTVKWIAEGID